MSEKDKPVYLQRKIEKKKQSVFIRVVKYAAIAFVGLVGFLVADTYFNITKSFVTNISGGSELLKTGTNLLDVLSGSTQTQVKLKDGRINTLILGYAGSGKDGDLLTDSIIVTSFDTVTKSASLINIPRDLLTEMPDSNCHYLGIYEGGVYKYKINSALESLINCGYKEETINDKMKAFVGKLTGIDIHYIVKLDFEGFSKAIDYIDGVDVNNPKGFFGLYGMKEFLNNRCPVETKKIWFTDGYYCLMNFPEGQLHLDGFNALAYARIRKAPSDYDQEMLSDIGRGKRQQAILTALKDKALKFESWINVTKITSLVKEFSGYIKTDFSIPEMLNFAGLAKGIDKNQIYSFVIDDKLVYDAIININVGQEQLAQFVFRPKDSSFKQIQTAIQAVLLKPTISKESPTIAIINSSGVEGKARSLSNTLKDSGFEVLSVGASKNKAITTSIIRTSKTAKPQSELNLEKTIFKQFGVLVKTIDKPESFSLPSDADMADLTVVLGTDINR